MFNCIIFVHGLTLSKDSEIRSQILTKLEESPKLILLTVTEECE